MLALVATGVELDRQARRDPELAAWVPAPFRSFAQAQMVVIRLERGEHEAAIREADTLVRRRPIPAESLFLLALAHYDAGSDGVASQALAISGERGWRVPQVQLAMIRIALNTGAIDMAASRLLALWSIGVDPQLLENSTRAVLAAPGGPEAFGKIVAESRFMQDAVLRSAGGYTSSGNYARMVHAAIAQGAEFDCAVLQMNIRSIQREGHKDEARMFMAPYCKNST
ncbi:hypothetical protein B2G71_19275 [Novosphingobium sp. PC22D]|nr:hypothetical protein B2G71_19275 [Novosphingobium sp. PC22D]